MKFQKLLAGALALVLVAGLGTPVFAVMDEYANTDEVPPASPLDTRQETVFSPQSVNLLTNGDFETGDFSGWTPFLTTNGVTDPNVALFDTDGDTVATQSAQFMVGQVIFEGFSFTNFRGGGILQTITTVAGTITISADIASDLTQRPPKDTSGNEEGGQFKLFFDSVEVDSHNFGFILNGDIERSTLNAQINGVPAGSHEVKIEITRPALAPLELKQYIDNIVVEGDRLVGGEFLPIDSTALVLAGLQTSAIWMLPVLAVAVGVGAYYIKTRMNIDN